MLVLAHHLRHHRRLPVNQMAVLTPHAADRDDAVRGVLWSDCDVVVNCATMYYRTISNTMNGTRRCCAIHRQ